MDYKMKLATLEKFFEGARKLHNQQKRDEALKRFPFTVIVEGSYPEMDYSKRWLWQQLGPIDCEECGDYCSEYPACPLVLAIEEYTIKKLYTKDGKVHEYDFHTRDPGKHGHEGIWTIVWLGKTDYDYGFSEYYFTNEADRDKFIAAVPTFGLGENYED